FHSALQVLLQSYIKGPAHNISVNSGGGAVNISISDNHAMQNNKSEGTSENVIVKTADAVVAGTKINDSVPYSKTA
ncbi:MAG TPA: hypothetical protein DC017_07685, partial [Candidatus Wallbacteria bacterium]|nr:hypothetical protein [Candidatus Wallbacteria bacterium]